MALTSAERQARYVKRQNDRGLYQVRGIYANLNDHEAIKRYAKKLTEKRYGGVDIDRVHKQWKK